MDRDNRDSRSRSGASNGNSGYRGEWFLQPRGYCSTCCFNWGKRLTLDRSSRPLWWVLRSRTRALPLESPLYNQSTRRWIIGTFVCRCWRCWGHQSGKRCRCRHIGLPVKIFFLDVMLFGCFSPSRFVMAHSQAFWHLSLPPHFGILNLGF